MKHRAITPLRFVRGGICLLVLISTAFMMLVYFGFMSAVIFRFFSIHYSRKMTSVVFASWLALWPFLFEKINKTKVVFSGETVPIKERILLLANHRTEVDWMYLWDLALRKNSLGYIKYVLKSSLMKLPIFGWSFHILEFIPVQRKWEIDEPIMHQMLSTLKDRHDPLWLAIFPEGTDFTEQKCIRSQKYAAEHGLPILNNVLLPKTKGFFACIDELRNTLDAVYDVTIGYKPSCPFFLDNVYGLNPSEVHIHIRRLSLSNIPDSEAGTGTWLMDTFCRKDKLLTEFYSTGHFPNEGTENELNTNNCLVNVIATLTLTTICTFLTFFSFVWFKIYVLLVCVYFTFATKLNYRPLPIFCFSNQSLKHNNIKQALD
ncbi:probable 1-acyl-sn-glycerol-3-phosphate acyltransferase 5 [Amaranthus tricolor]|uniref:probable 1-acyl-sn-glycerol-3-phosphate acyltransferase 5 n=1 Tax=Amaranthus tricolor TaxID=29722 RepID=UPI00258C58E0|nr:probable 1-acyl-sn-glycerol-3-phosphate acyltransferase 5 [Amaranthus tricolor]XP_057550497.1 probable 1-acyl-sn-glycerol-3-phosphate acyltransferase 5 [Amaranthus tricolor]XP_057550501.1 probable 1-acyl-sn-glycerol-3-phosphate acyltransferase 5 [Amaranthus tricolor]XP_057550505.1 probable 1-acyl-sn-glycerol-3-phosphate acyltransferase 5 [Amaranthus tricolor]XP_057550512.1 probable 1-acyl-sn-glycerol-3-phosphate acyltransferase 5 [Amaranthus tricolor]XP_057550514.1 probable 1-acyl-sn-glycer